MTTVTTLSLRHPEQRFVLRNVSWQEYESLLELLRDRPVRMTYDRGTLELMSPSAFHEHVKRLIGRMIEMLTYELNLPMRSGGSTTFRRQDLDRGLEPDECYWLGHASAVPLDRELDLTRDPPPDLAVEIDITRSSLDRHGIYAALRVPEIWQYDGQRLRVFHLRPDGEYEQRDHSAAFPFLAVQALVPFLHSDERANETAWLRSFVDWLRAQNFPKAP